MEETVHLNVGGSRHEILWTTLQKHPGTRLAKIRDVSKEKKITAFDPLYFDRNPTIFTSILDFYRTGKLCFNENVCADKEREGFKKKKN